MDAEPAPRRARPSEVTVLEGAGGRAPRASDAGTRVDSAARRFSVPNDAGSRLDGEPAVDADPLIGFVVADRYRILERLGSGAMGVVYEVEHTQLGKRLAMKLLSGGIAHAGPTVGRFKREALLASRLSSPHTVQVFDFGATNGLTWLVMELVQGVDLARVIRDGGPLPFARVSRIVAHVCTALSEAHALGIVHRDIKPGNIMIASDESGEDVAKVLDFGLAKLRDTPVVSDLSAVGTILGTPFYMAPEQIQGGPVDGRTDVYALGAVMYRALTGQPVFAASSPAEVYARHLTDPPIAPHLRAPDLAIPEAVSRVVLRALEKAPAQRYASVDDLRRAVLDAASVGAAPEVAAEPAAAQAEAPAVAAAAEPAVAVAGRDTATRDELAAYERRLARQLWIGRGIAAAIVAGALAAGAFVGLRAYRAGTGESFDGTESEPNDDAAHADDVPFGRTVSGHLGQRLRDGQGDRDFFRIDVPPTSNGVSIHTTALPNMATCTLVFASGTPEPVARFCLARPRLGLALPALRLAPGTYYFAVLQDREARGATPAPDVVENVSDAYHLTVEPAAAAPSDEVEPNDAVSEANEVAPGGTLGGQLAWPDDVDVVCVEPGQGPPVRWVVRDVGDHLEDRGALLEVTPIGGGLARGPVRVHRAAVTGPGGARDVPTPWRSDPMARPGAARETCVRLRLVADPAKAAARLPPGGRETWSVAVEEVAEPHAPPAHDAAPGGGRSPR